MFFYATTQWIYLLAGETQPDVNLTILPSTTVEVLSEISVICDADVPRFPNVSNTSALLPPVRISIRVGIYEVKMCPSNVVDPIDSAPPVFQCIYNLTSFFPGIPRRISCTAFNAQGGCRFKTDNVTLLELG